MNEVRVNQESKRENTPSQSAQPQNGQCFNQDQGQGQVRSNGQDMGMQRHPTLTPPICISESSGAYKLEVQMPGVSKEGVSLTLDNGFLTIVGKRGAPSFGNLLYGEISWGDYQRVLEIDSCVDMDKICAFMSQGSLTLELPKVAAKKPRTICVEG